MMDQCGRLGHLVPNDWMKARVKFGWNLESRIKMFGFKKPKDKKTKNKKTKTKKEDSKHKW